MKINTDEEGLKSVDEYAEELVKSLEFGGFLLNSNTCIPDEEFTLRDEANAITAYAFRNTALEDLHAGKYCEELEDKSRISDAEMKRLMLEVTRRLTAILSLMEQYPDAARLLLRMTTVNFCGRWER